MKKEESKEEAGDEGQKDENPLEKYIKLVLEAREKQQVQVGCIHVTCNSRLALGTCLKPVFFSRALTEKRQDTQAQKQRVRLRKRTGNVKLLTWVDTV